jgi:hypothetical protein
MDDKNGLISLSGGEVVLWLEDERAIHLKAVTFFGDPVELSAEEAKELAEALMRLAARAE